MRDKGFYRQPVQILSPCFWPELGKVVIQGLVDIQFSLFLQLHNGQGGKCLGDRFDIHNCILGHGDMLLFICISEPLFPYHGIVKNKCSTYPDQVIGFHFTGYQVFQFMAHHCILTRILGSNLFEQNKQVRNKEQKTEGLPFHFFDGMFVKLKQGIHFN